MPYFAAAIRNLDIVRIDCNRMRTGPIRLTLNRGRTMSYVDMIQSPLIARTLYWHNNCQLAMARSNGLGPKSFPPIANLAGPRGLECLVA
jgi:hypothetical protein